MNKQKMVDQFHLHVDRPDLMRAVPGFPNNETCELRVALIAEELEELKTAIIEKNIYEVADALGDLLYVVYGASSNFGIDIDPIFKEIHRSNMTKKGSGKASNGKILKGSNYTPPNIKSVLNKQIKKFGDLNND